MSYLPGLDAIAFYQYDARNIGLYFCRKHVLQTVLPDVTSEGSYPPSHIHPHDRNTNAFYVMFPDCICLAEADDGKKVRIIMNAESGKIANLLDDGSEASELIFITSVPPVNNRLLLRLGEITYEWNATKETLTPRYNVAYYTNVALLPDYGHEWLILVHQNSSINVFEAGSRSLTRSLCFHETGYQVADACYHPGSALLAMTLIRGDHEKILLVSIITGEETYCFSTGHPDETILSIDFHDRSPLLLIATQSRCCEYSTDTASILTVRESSGHERILGASYVNGGIEIIVTPHRISDALTFPPRCEYHEYDRKKAPASYTFLRYYIVPSLEKKLAPYLVTAYNDLGHMGPVDEDGIQEYWLTEGYFMTGLPYPLELPEINYYTPDGECIITRPIRPYDSIFFRHSYAFAAMDFSSFPEPNDLRYTWLDQDTGSAVFIDKNQHICRSDDYRSETYADIGRRLDKDCEFYDDNPLWEHVIPWDNGNLAACFEGYNLHVLDTASGCVKLAIPYTPGMSVCGCEFIDCEISDESKEILGANGAIVLKAPQMSHD